MFLKKWNINVIIALAVLVGIIILFSVYYPIKKEKFVSSGPWGAIQRNIREYGYDIGFTKDAITEGFVPYNSEQVGNYQVSLVQLDQASLETLFKNIVDQDKGKIDQSTLSAFREQPYAPGQADAYTNYVLATINRNSGRKFHALDVQSVKKELAVDTATNGPVERWSSELFIHEKDSRKVHANATNISMELLVKGSVIQITDLHFITDYFYQKPLVDGMNVYEKYFRIKNPFSLQQPFFTSEDKVIPDTNTTDTLLNDYHQDLRKPQYRCFSDTGPQQADTQSACSANQGYWDQPVKNDTDCPFFMANKNYPNRLGGVNINSNRCDMPVGTKTIGYRFISNDPAHKPWCYNCREGADGMPGSIGPCCDDQRDTQLYPELGGNPDYAYEGDTIERGQNWKLLADRGLNWAAHPTKIKDVTNPAQKMPVFASFIGPG